MVIDIEVSVLASGSNGNACLINHKDTSILIDAGKSGKELESRAHKLNKTLENLNGILITHAHSDHIQSAGILSRRYNIPIYMTKPVYSDAQYKLGNIKEKIFQINKSFRINNLIIKPVQTSHNVDSCGFQIESFGLFTDTGIVTQQMKQAMPKLKAVLLESNHDVDMVVHGPYPHFLKNWILSDRGHLNNFDASQLIQDQGSNLQLALLGHLSGNNNTPEKAKETYEHIVKRKLDYHVCSREKATGTFHV